MRAYLLLFFSLFLIYNSNLRPIASGDSLPAALIPFEVLLDGSVTLDRFGPWLESNVPYAPEVMVRRRGHWFSRYPVAGPMLVTPMYLPVLAVPGIRAMPPATIVAVARILEKLAASAVAALSAVILLILLRRLTSPGWAWTLTFVYALCTATWSTSSQALWQHTPGQLAIIGCFAFLELWTAEPRRVAALWACGACLAAAVAIRPTNGVLLPAVALALLSVKASGREYVRVFTGALLGTFAVLAINVYVFSSPSGAYPSKLQGNFVQGLAGVLFSPGRGLLVYTPVAAFAFAAFFRRAAPARARHRPLAVAAAAFAVLHTGVIAGWPAWWGGYCWGPRMLAEIVPGLMVLIAISTPALAGPTARTAFAIAGAYCLFIQAVGVYFYPEGHWDHRPVPVNDAPGRLWDWKDNPISRTVAAGPAWQPYVVVAEGFRGGIPAAREKLRELRINAF